MDRSNHYEAAFEDWLQENDLCYVAVDESRRAMLGGIDAIPGLVELGHDGYLGAPLRQPRREPTSHAVTLIGWRHTRQGVAGEARQAGDLARCQLSYM